MPRKLYIFVLVSVCVLAGLALLLATKSDEEAGTSKNQASAVLVNQSALAALPQKSASSADVSHLASNITPPTNTWFSGMVLQSTPEPVYPMPMSFLAQAAGFELGLPAVSSTATQISGSHTPGLKLGNAADGFKLTRYDKLSATLTYSKSANTLANVTVTEGSPFVFYRAQSSHPITIENVGTDTIQKRSEHYVRYTQNGKTYAIVSKKATIVASNGTLTIDLAKDNLLTLYALPGTDDFLEQYADNRIDSVLVTHSRRAENIVTTFDFKTANGKPTVLAAMPYTGVSGKQIGTYGSIWGDMKVYSGSSFTANAKTVKPSNELDVSKLSSGQKDQIIASLPADIAATKIDAQDSYYAGKQLARAANLLSLAQQLDQKAAAMSLKELLSGAFTARLGTDFFYYDTTLKGVAASKAAFGSEDFNDHHFHYGYWLYAASILAKYDDGFLKQHADQLNLLAADIASLNASTQFPAYRNYDPYVGHSWAAGLAPFTDGNNQESSSEAMHAWNGAALWGSVTKNDELEQTAQWMLANESNTAGKAWRSVDVSSSGLSNYTAPIASLNFGGKRTYNTFFSAEPSAKLGIQLIPMDPTMQSFRSDKQTITNSLDKTVQANNYNVPLGDYMLQYLSLVDAPKAEQLLAKQTAIDDGNSYSYLKAFIYLQ